MGSLVSQMKDFYATVKGAECKSDESTRVRFSTTVSYSSWLYSGYTLIISTQTTTPDTSCREQMHDNSSVDVVKDPGHVTARDVVTLTFKVVGHVIGKNKLFVKNSHKSTQELLKKNC
jgi:hypothetical protein